jgi:hypothetical protein
MCASSGRCQRYARNLLSTSWFALGGAALRLGCFSRPLSSGSRLPRRRLLCGSDSDRSFMSRLVETDLAATRDGDGRQASPAYVANFRALHALVLKSGDRCLNVVAHQVQLVIDLAIRRVDAELCRGHREDDPSVAHINEWKLKHIAKKCADFVGIGGVNQRVYSCNHGDGILAPTLKVATISLHGSRHPPESVARSVKSSVCL